MASPAIILAFDVQGKALISFNGSPSTFDKLKRGVYLTHIYLREKDVDSLPGVSVETSAFDGTSIYGIRVGFWSTSPGTDESLLTLTDTDGWEYITTDPDNPYFEGTINLSDQRVIDWLDTDTCKDCFFAVATVNGQGIAPIYDYATCETENFEIQNPTDPGSGSGISVTSETPFVNLPFNMKGAAGYYTWSESSPGVLDHTYTPY